MPPDLWERVCICRGESGVGLTAATAATEACDGDTRADGNHRASDQQQLCWVASATWCVVGWIQVPCQIPCTMYHIPCTTPIATTGARKREYLLERDFAATSVVLQGRIRDIFRVCLNHLFASSTNLRRHGRRPKMPEGARRTTLRRR